MQEPPLALVLTTRGWGGGGLRVTCGRLRSTSIGGVRLPGRTSHAKEGPEAADNLMNHEHEENGPKDANRRGRNPRPRYQPSAQQEIDLVHNVDEEHCATTARSPRRYVEPALEKAVGELAEHSSGPQREAEQGEAEGRESVKHRRLKLRNEALQAVPSGRPERDGHDAAVGLVGPKKRTAPKQSVTVEGNGEGPQPPELDAQAVEDKPHEQRPEQRRNEGELAHRFGVLVAALSSRGQHDSGMRGLWSVSSVSHSRLVRLSKIRA